ncbi:hypothetical protein [Mycobacterium sp.]|uniref:hypothetical protein n=1 Tax=Mycobacterium sp. TaxID=1785 RepID=UPI002D84F3DC|nr:hypothetical protein [Mycobacterium sp.]
MSSARESPPALNNRGIKPEYLLLIIPFALGAFVTSTALSHSLAMAHLPLAACQDIATLLQPQMNDAHPPWTVLAVWSVGMGMPIISGYEPTVSGRTPHANTG